MTDSNSQAATAQSLLDQASDAYLTAFKARTTNYEQAEKLFLQHLRLLADDKKMEASPLYALTELFLTYLEWGYPSLAHIIADKILSYLQDRSDDESREYAISAIIQNYTYNGYPDKAREAAQLAAQYPQWFWTREVTHDDCVSGIESWELYTKQKELELEAILSRF